MKSPQRPPDNWIKIDLVIQFFILVLIIFSLIYWPIALALTLPFGIWQMFSGIIGAVYGSTWRMRYLGFCLIYILLIVLMNVFDDYYNFSWTNITIIVTPPPVLGIYYLYMTYREFNEIKDNPQKKNGTYIDMEDILDSDIMQNE